MHLQHCECLGRAVCGVRVCVLAFGFGAEHHVRNIVCVRHRSKNDGDGVSDDENDDDNDDVRRRSNRRAELKRASACAWARACVRVLGTHARTHFSEKRTSGRVSVL